MKKILYTLLILSMFIISCSKDDGPIITHEMGDWTLDSYILQNLPAGFVSYEDRIVPISGITFGGVAFESYELSLVSDKTFTRKIKVTGPDLNDNGTWELDASDALILNSEDSETDEEYNLVQNEDEKLWWAIDSQFSLLPDAVADTVTQTWIDANVEAFNALFVPVTLDLVYAFERQ